jgi:hypothetical protein
MEVEFATGDDLNDRIDGKPFPRRSIYALLWFGKGKVARILIAEKIRLSAYTFDKADYTRMYRDHPVVSGEDQSEKQWRILLTPYWVKD